MTSTINKLLNWQVSIRWQRSLLTILAIALTAHYFWQTQAATNTGAIELSPPTLSASFTNLDYGEIELALANLQFENGFLVMDANTESEFRVVLEQLPTGFEDTHLGRIAFLTQQQFDANQSEQIISLLLKMATYIKQEAAWWKENATASAAGDNLNKFDQLFELQDQLLGEALAQQLYGEQRRLTRYMAAARAIETDGSLSEQQKQNALEALANTLEQSQQQSQPGSQQ